MYLIKTDLIIQISLLTICCLAVSCGPAIIENPPLTVSDYENFQLPKKKPPSISSQSYFPKASWRTSAPKEQGLDQDKINTFIQQLKGGKLQRPISSFSIVKNGYLVVNETFGSYDGQTPHTLQSVTKSITSTLVGTAIQKGFINNLDQKVIEFFPKYEQIDHLDANKKAMTLRHALTMRTGQAWTGESHLSALNRYSGDKMKYVLDYEMETQPGKQWYYNSGIAILLGGLLQNATGMNTKDFAQQYLFEPLNITSGQWSWGHKGIPHTGGGLYLKPTDMARIGYLYLRNGKWENQQILPEWWVKEATTRQVPFAESISGVSSIGYGYMWWLMPLEKKDKDTSKAEIFMAYGHWGQFIFVIPKYDMVVIFTNNNSASYAEEIKPIGLLYEYVLGAVKG